MSSLREQLERFNRKERYWVVQTALGRSAGQQLGAEFLKTLSDELGEPVPADAWWAMDYHLDWLVAAIDLRWPQGGAERAALRSNAPHELHGPLVTGTQEDIDLVVAYGDTVLLIEAKADTAWGNAQVSSKLRRLAAIEARHGAQVMDNIRLVLMSPARPSKLVNGNKDVPWPACMRKRDGSAQPLWVPLSMGSEAGRKSFSTVTRCDQEGTPSANGQHWKVVDRTAVVPS